MRERVDAGDSPRPGEGTSDKAAARPPPPNPSPPGGGGGVPRPAPPSARGGPRGSARTPPRPRACGGGDPGSGTRPLAVRVKRARRRKPSSTEWLARQLNDPYVAEAHRAGYRSRAAFKLIQLDVRFHLLAPGSRVVDLGCAPGGWTQVAVERVGKRGAVVGIDLNPTDPIPGATVLQGDFTDPATAAQIRDALGGPADLVLSDMAAPATGHAATDHLRIVAL